MKFTTPLLGLCVALSAACAPDDSDQSQQELIGGSPWQEPILISAPGANASTRFNFGKTIAVDGAGVLHQVWVEVDEQLSDSEVAGQVFYRRSADGGETWLPQVALTPRLATVGYPKIAALGPYVYVVFHLDFGGGPSVVFVRSVNHGDRFDAPIPLGTGGLPSVAASASGVHVAWAGTDPATGAPEVFVRSSSDFGGKWLAAVMASTPDGISSWTPMVAAVGMVVDLVWTDERINQQTTGFDCGLDPDRAAIADGDDDGCREEVYFRRSTTFGQSWGPEIRLSRGSPAVGTNAASIAIDGGKVHVAYFKKPDPATKIFYAQSNDGGLTFEPEKQLSAASETGAGRPSVAASGGTVQIAYHRIISGVGGFIYVITRAPGAAAFSAPEQISTAGRGLEPTLVLDHGDSYVAYEDRISGSQTGVYFQASYAE